MKKTNPTFTLRLRRWAGSLHPGAVLTVLAIVLVGLRLLWIHAQRPAHLEENAGAYGSIRDFYGPAQMNHDGSKLVYVATADNRGRSVFLIDTHSGNKKQIIEDTNGVGIWRDDFDIQAGPWSPDDSAFIVRMDNRLLISTPETNHILGHLEIGSNVVASEAVWLSPTGIAWHEEGAIGFAEKNSDGEWKARRLPYSGEVTSLSAIDTHSIAWLQDNYICRLDVSKDFANQISRPNFEDDKSPVTNGLVLWLDASTLQLPDQAPVTALDDLSPRHNTAVVNQNPPKFNAPGSASALNGKGTISFSSSAGITQASGLVTRRSSGINGNRPRTMFAVMRREVGKSMIVGLGNPGVGGAYFGLADQFDGFRLPATMATEGRVAALPRNWNILSVVHDGNSQNGYVNGDLKCSTPAQLTTADAPVELGVRTVASGQDWRAGASDGGVAELLVYDRALTEPERRRVESYLALKYFNKKLLSPRSPLVWFDVGLNGITGLSYSRETGQFLISGTERGRDSIWRLNTASGSGPVPIQILQGQSLRGAQWAGADGVVYTNHLDTRDSLIFADLSSGAQKHLLQFWGNGSFEWFKVSPDQKQVFMLRTMTNEPAPGIWRCDIASGTWSRVVSRSDYPSVPPVNVVRQTMNLPGGNPTVTIYRPANFDKQKKYPLVIGDTMITDPIYGEPFMTGMAASGAIVAVVERPWWTVGIEQWPENVQGLYEQLKHDSTVDSRRVYVFAASAETYYLSQLVGTDSLPLRGLILLNPSTLPRFSTMPPSQSRPKMLLDAGGEEHQEENFKQYQTNALNSGVVVEYYTHPGETHRMVGVAPKLERARELKHFIFEE
jgi:hypothetical protein